MTPKPAKKKRKSKAELMFTLARRYTTSNNLCAQLILNDTKYYGGPDALMVRWASMILNGYTRTPADWYKAA